MIIPNKSVPTELPGKNELKKAVTAMSRLCYHFVKEKHNFGGNLANSSKILMQDKNTDAFPFFVRSIGC